MTIRRVNAREIPYIEKEAVTDGLLGALANYCSGLSDEQRTIIGHSPMDRLATGMLVPSPSLRNEYADEVESTIHISAIGLDTLINSGDKLPLKVKPRGFLFVRVLPTTLELQEDRFATDFRPNTEINTRIKSVKKAIFQSPEGDYQEKQQRFNTTAQNILVDALHLADESNLVTLDSEDGESFVSGVFSAKPGDELRANSDALELKEVVPKYYRLKVNFSEQILLLDPTGENEDVISDVVSIWQTEIDSTIRNWVNDKDPQMGGLHWAYNRRQKFSFSQIINWDETLKEIAAARMAQSPVNIEALDCPTNLQIGMHVSFNHNHNETNQFHLHIEFSNTTATTRIGEVQDSNNILFGAGFSLIMPKLRHKALQMERVKPSFRFKDYLTFDMQGFNVGIETHISGDELYANTTWLPRYYQPRIAPKEHGSIPLTFKKLKTIAGVTQLSALPIAYDKWIKEIQQQDPTDGSDKIEEKIKSFERHQYGNACKLWKNECTRIARGIDLLIQAANAPEKSEAHIPFVAWQALNETMEIANKNKFDGWRTFQLAFILSLIPVMASRVPYYHRQYDPSLDQVVQLLYFATGGGKSEAFYGVLIYQLFIDRLRGKARGVTAMISYPLRLLTTQQAQRLARILAQADKVRFNRKMGGAAFSIGFWVGGQNTPNTNITKDLQEKVPPIGQTKKPSDSELCYQQEINKLPKCPYCNGETILRRIPSWDEQLGIFCTDESCDWNGRNTKLVPLPFYLTDDDIYARAPSILVGTVDKLSQIAYKPISTQRVLGMFGGALARDKTSERLISPTQFNSKDDLNNPNWVKLYPADPNGEKWFHDPFPAFRVADEVHLLEESLGSFTGLYETLFHTVLEDLSPSLTEILSKDEQGNIRFPEYIAATATVADPAHQVKNLYMRDCLQFPSPGNTLYESFYAGPDRSGQNPARLVLNGDPEDYAARARIYASMLTNGKAHTSATVDVLASFHLLISKTIRKLEEGDESAIKQQLIDGLGATAVKPLYERTICAIDENVLGTIIDLHRIALTYVTNKKGGDQIITAERDRNELWHAEAGLNVFIEPQLISGDLTLGQIENVVKRSEENREVDTLIDMSSGIRSVVATSAVSHGVDVEQYNSMFFAGMPNDTAEFIQASSRIGRTYSGFSLLLPTPQRRRDRYIVEVNQPYYRFLERMILPPSIDRWADNAIRRTISSFLMAFLGLRMQIAQLTSGGGSIRLEKQTSRTISRFIHNPTETKALMNFMYKAYGLDCPTNRLKRESVNYYKTMIEEFLITELLNEFVKKSGSEEIFVYLKGLDQRGLSRQKLYTPMTSLRDISETGKIGPATNERVNKDDFLEMMNFISHSQG